MDRRTAWIEAARPRTLPAAVAPVVVGSALAHSDGAFRWDAFIATMLGALAIQVAANFANDASDAKRGADTADRVGPQRMVSTGLISPRAMWSGVALAVGVATAMGLWLIAISGWWVVVVGVVSIAAMLTYVGGPIPYGYRGLGELMVFIFFGLVATLGTRYAHGPELAASAWLAAVAMGALAAAILVANNLRDLNTDRAVGKRTLAVILGPERSKMLYQSLVILPLAMIMVAAITGVLPVWALLVLGALPMAGRLLATVRTAETAAELIPVLGGSARFQLAVSLLLAVGVVV